MPATVPHALKDTAIEGAQTATLEPEPPLPFRNDTILGVCEAIGRDFGFNPLYLRLVFAGLFYFNPLMVIGTYLALGAGVALARWLYPDATADVTQPVADPAAPAAENEDSEKPPRRLNFVQPAWPLGRQMLPWNGLNLPQRKPKAA